MKEPQKITAAATLFALPLTGMTAEPQEQPAVQSHKVVFEVVIDGAEKWEAALRNVEKVRRP